MKVTIIETDPGEEEEIILKCKKLNDDMIKLIKKIKQGKEKLHAYSEGKIFLLEYEEVYYFESVDQKVFAYGEKEVYEVKNRLYELEEELPEVDFIRSSKSTILNMNKIESLSPVFGGRFEAFLANGEKVVISRQYVRVLKERLGIR